MGYGGETRAIKIAMITPEGSTWTNALYRMTREIRERTKNEVGFKIFAGGVSGDELDVLRKMQVNRIHAAGFSGVGLGVLLPKVRILETPLLYRTYQEVDRVKSSLMDEFYKDLDKKGYILLGFAEAGFVYFFSKVKMSGPRGFKPLKMWVWKGDPVAKLSLETFGIKTFPLNITDVTTGLETGMINSYYSPPLASIAFQWYSKIDYMLDYPMANSTGAFLIKKSVFNQLSPGNRKIFREAAGKFCDELVRLTRKENQEARAVLISSGIQLESPTSDQITAFEGHALDIFHKNIGRTYSRELFERVQTILKETRQ